MTTLVLTSSVGPTEGAILSSCHAAGGEAVFYNTSTHELIGAGDVKAPPWLGRPFFRHHHPHAAGYFRSLLESRRVERVLSVGLDASADALQLVPDNLVIPLLFRGHLDFSKRRTRYVQQFGRVNRSAGILVLEDPWEMDKAVGHGSVLSHARLPGSVLSREHVLRPTGKPRVAVLVDEMPRQHQTLPQLDPLIATLSEVAETSAVDIGELYGPRDLAMRRGFTETLRYRIGDYTHAIILGDSPHTWAVFNGLFNDLDRVYIEDTVNSHHMYPDGWPNAAHGVALGDRARRGVLRGGRADYFGNHSPFPAQPASAWTNRLDTARDADGGAAPRPADTNDERALWQLSHELPSQPLRVGAVAAEEFPARLPVDEVVRLVPGYAIEQLTKGSYCALILDRSAFTRGPWAGTESAVGIHLLQQLEAVTDAARRRRIPVLLVDAPLVPDISSEEMRSLAGLVLPLPPHDFPPEGAPTSELLSTLQQLARERIDTAAQVEMPDDLAASATAGSGRG